MKRLALLLMLLLSIQLVPNQTLAQDHQSLDGHNLFAQLPVMHQGRLKPMNSYARAQLAFLGAGERNAAKALQDILFNPARAERLELIKLTNPDVLNTLKLPRRKSKLYSYSEVNAALFAHKDLIDSVQKTPQKDWTQAQRDIAVLQEKLVRLSDLMASMSAFLPIAIPVPNLDGHTDLAALKPYEGQRVTYWDVLKIQKPLEETARSIAKRYGDDLDAYPPADMALMQISFAAQSLRIKGQISQDFRILPDADKSAAWISPWHMMLAGKGTPAQSKILQKWRDLATAYHDSDGAAWNKAVAALHSDMRASLPNNWQRNALVLEYMKTKLQPVKLSAAFFGFALFLLGAHALIKALKSRDVAWLSVAAIGAISIGLALQFMTLLSRIYILQRPPVSTLYESILFVGAICVACALWFAVHKRDPFWRAASAGLGLMLSVLALSHGQDGDTMVMLSAVLNTNFWLATHVICITAGYGFCVLTSVLAHYSLWKSYQNGQPPSKQDDLQKTMHSLALIALLLTSVGTVLGGIWADQSWGRFWGWDPKENGALLIVLWLIWILHGRISGQLQALAVTAGLAYLGVITALSWFGVNLLSVGLHAYGFTSGAATALFTFVAIETAAIGWMWRGVLCKQKH